MPRRPNNNDGLLAMTAIQRAARAMDRLSFCRCVHGAVGGNVQQRATLECSHLAGGNRWPRKRKLQQRQSHLRSGSCEEKFAQQLLGFEPSGITDRCAGKGSIDHAGNRFRSNRKRPRRKRQAPVARRRVQPPPPRMTDPRRTHRRSSAFIGGCKRCPMRLAIRRDCRVAQKTTTGSSQ